MSWLQRLRDHFAETEVDYRCEKCGTVDKRDPLGGPVQRHDDFDHDAWACNGTMRQVKA